MRLYLLETRYGHVKSGVFPWFKPPEAGEPRMVDGWRYDYQKGEWVEDEIEPKTVTMEVGVGPRPQRPPGLADPTKVEGWEWSDSMQEWMQMPMPMETVQVTETRPPMPTYYPAHPGVGEVLGWKFDFVGESWEPVWMPTKFIQVEKTRPPAPEYPPEPALTRKVPGWEWDRNLQEWIRVLYAEKVEVEFVRPLPPGSQVTDEQVEIAKASAYGQVYTLLRNEGFTDPQISMIVSGWMRTLKAEGFRYGHDIYRAMLASMQKHIAIQQWDPGAPTAMSTVLMYAVIVMFIIAVLGALWKLLKVSGEYVGLEPPEATYLLGPDIWYYGKHVGTSVRGKAYYSCCYEACPASAVHLRSSPPGAGDSIVFPDGFVEEGWAWGKYRKYAWERWAIRYVGFLIRINDGLFMLKTRDLPAGAPPFPVFMEADDQWCTNFHYYL